MIRLTGLFFNPLTGMNLRVFILSMFLYISGMAQDTFEATTGSIDNPSSASLMQIEVWSDISCPFCYLGKKNFEKALDESGYRDRVRVTWRSYQLNPGMRTEPGLTLYDFLKREKGWEKPDVLATENRLNQAGMSVGIHYRFDQVVVANTLRAHALLHFANKLGKQPETGERLFRAYFTEGVNVDDIQSLLKVAEASGLDIAGLEKSLTSGAFDADIRNDIAEAERLNIRGVPYFLVDRKYAVSGAQEPQVFIDTLKKAFGEK